MKLNKAIKSKPWSYREKRRFAFYDKFRLKGGDTVIFALEWYNIRERYVGDRFGKWIWTLWEIEVNGEWKEYYLNNFYGTTSGSFNRYITPELKNKAYEMAKKAKKS
jgi:hypothetical protein